MVLLCRNFLVTYKKSSEFIVLLLFSKFNIQIQPGLKAKLQLINLQLKSNNKLLIQNFEGKGKLFQSETSYIELITLYVHPQNSKHLRSHSRSQQIRPRKQILGKQITPNFLILRSTGLLYKFLPTNLGVFKPTFYNFYTPHLR